MALWSMGANQSTVEGTANNRALHQPLPRHRPDRPPRRRPALADRPAERDGRARDRRPRPPAARLPQGRRREDHRREVERTGACPAGSIAERPGLPATDLFDALEDGRVKAVWICAPTPPCRMPDAERARAALAQGRARRRPGRLPPDRDDRARPRRPARRAVAGEGRARWPTPSAGSRSCARPIDPPGEARRTGRSSPPRPPRMGFGEAFAWPDAAAVYDEFAALTAGRPCDQSGVSHARLDREGSSSGRAAQVGRPRHRAALRRRRFPTPDGRPRLAAAVPGDPAEPPDADHPLVLTTGRIAEPVAHDDPHGQVGRAARRGAGAVRRAAPGRRRARRLRDGDRARVVSRRGAVVLRVRIDDTLPEGTAFAPFHWGALHAPAGAGGVNDLLHRETDPVSRQPGSRPAPCASSPRAPARPGARRGSATCSSSAAARPASPPPSPRWSTRPTAPGGSRIAGAEHAAALRPRRLERPPRRPPRGRRPPAAPSRLVRQARDRRARGHADRVPRHRAAHRHHGRRRGDRLRRARARHRLAPAPPAVRRHRARRRVPHARRRATRSAGAGTAPAAPR